MAKIKGCVVKVKVDGTVIGGQRGATLNRSAETLDESSKDSAGWKENGIGYKEWGVDCDGLLIETNAGYEALEEAFENDTPVAVDITEPSGKKYEGNAFVTDFPVEYPYDDYSTYSMTFVGTGALTRTPATGE